MRKVNKRKKRNEKENFEIGGKQFVLDYGKRIFDLNIMTSISESRLQIDTYDISEQLLLIGIMRARAQKKIMDVTTNFKIWRAEIKKEIMEELEEEYGKRPTKEQVETELFSLEEYRSNFEQENLAKQDYEILDSIYWAIHKKSEIVTNLFTSQKKVEQLRSKRLSRR